MAVTFGVFYWLILTLAVPLAVIDGIEPSLAHYLFTPKFRKYFSSYTPCLGTYWILKMIGIAVDFDGEHADCKRPILRYCKSTSGEFKSYHRLNS